MSGPIRGFSTSIVMRFNERIMSVALTDINKQKQASCTLLEQLACLMSLFKFVRSTGSVRFHLQGHYLKY